MREQISPKANKKKSKPKQNRNVQLKTNEEIREKMNGVIHPLAATMDLSDPASKLSNKPPAEVSLRN